MSKDEYESLYYKTVTKEHKYWSLVVMIKYMAAAQKFLFDDEESARTVYDAFTLALKKDRDYSNDRERMFTFTCLGNSSTTIDIHEVSYISLNPPVSIFFEDEEDEQR